MKFQWEVTEKDIGRVSDYYNKNKTPYVNTTIDRNIHHRNIVVDKDTMLQTMLITLLSSDADLFPKDKIDAMLGKKSLLLTYQNLLKVSDLEHSLEEIFTKSGITKYINKVPKYFSNNFDFLVRTEWNLEYEINKSLGNAMTKQEERALADTVDQCFKGFGSKEARSFLLMLGVIRYEIPIDNKFISWLESFDFPVKFSKTALQDKLFYHFISDAVQLLCEKAGIFPCALYASVLSGTGTVN